MAASARIEVSADLRFSIELPGREPVCGTVTGSGNRLEVRLSDPASFAGGRDAAHLRGFAAALASQGITVVVIAGDVVLLEVGRTDPPWWQRRLSKSRHLKVVSVRGAMTGAVGRLRGRSSAAVLPGSELVPPTAVLPFTAMFGRAEHAVASTHDPRRAGNPRLVLTVANSRLPDDARVLYPLLGRRTTIGSDPGCDICLPGLEPVHAAVLHDERDEFVVEDLSRSRTTSVNGMPATAAPVLRTGARLDVGAWSFAYRRADYADHGRPFGGRIGGEAGHQLKQPPVPTSEKPGPAVVLDPRGIR